MPKFNVVRRLRTFLSDSFRRSSSGRFVSTIGLVFVFFFLFAHFIDKRSVADNLLPNSNDVNDELFEVNNFGANVNLVSFWKWTCYV